MFRNKIQEAQFNLILQMLRQRTTLEAIKRKIIVQLLIGIVFFSNCGPTCQEFVERDFRKKEYDLIILGKDYSTRDVIFYGRNVSGKLDTFKETGYGDIYNAANIGDSIKKQKGKTIIYLVKKDTIIEFPCYCGQTKIE